MRLQSCAVQVCNGEMSALTKSSTILSLGSVSIRYIDHIYGILPAIAPSISEPTSFLLAFATSEVRRSSQPVHASPATWRGIWYPNQGGLVRLILFGSIDLYWETCHTMHYIFIYVVYMCICNYRSILLIVKYANLTLYACMHVYAISFAHIFTCDFVVHIW